MLPEKGAEKREGRETQHPLQGADSERRDELIITEAVSGLWKRGWKYCGKEAGSMVGWRCNSGFVRMMQNEL